MKTYTWSCVMANGITYQPKRKFRFREAQKAMAEDKKTFTGCHSWKLVANA